MILRLKINTIRNAHPESIIIMNLIGKTLKINSPVWYDISENILLNVKLLYVS